jgi:ribose-phosphate pyrophosphokinase
MVVTNSIPISINAIKSGRIRVLTIGKMLAEAMRRVSNEESISAMFDEK